MKNTAANKTDTAESRARILKELELYPRTANQVIDKIFNRDVNAGAVLKRSWKYYVHLNKLFSPMEKDGLIKCINTVKGPSGKPEKVWSTNNE